MTNRLRLKIRRGRFLFGEKPSILITGNIFKEFYQDVLEDGHIQKNLGLVHG